MCDIYESETQESDMSWSSGFQNHHDRDSKLLPMETETLHTFTLSHTGTRMREKLSGETVSFRTGFALIPCEHGTSVGSPSPPSPH